MNGTCSTHERDENYIRSFHLKIWKEAPMNTAMKLRAPRKEGSVLSG
jgi:hypothetical protein